MSLEKLTVGKIFAQLRASELNQVTAGGGDGYNRSISRTRDIEILGKTGK
ncbi:MAG: hypothetical protein GY757_29450 [bacterium]|nr:hypothetical protein [bacterium]